MTTDTEFLSALKGRLPTTRRKGDFYRKLDASLPDWASVVSAPEFPSWMMRIDSQSGACMFDRLNALWQDPVYSSEDFAALLRLFVRWKREQDEHRSPSGWQGWTRRESTPPAGQAPYPVLSGKYELLSLLGRGGNGDVYLAWSRDHLPLRTQDDSVQSWRSILACASRSATRRDRGYV